MLRTNPPPLLPSAKFWYQGSFNPKPSFEHLLLLLLLLLLRFLLLPGTSPPVGSAKNQGADGDPIRRGEDPEIRRAQLHAGHPGPDLAPGKKSALGGAWVVTPLQKA